MQCVLWVLILISLWYLTLECMTVCTKHTLLTVFVFLYLCVYIFVYVHVCATCKHVCSCMCVWCVCMHTRICVCVCVHMNAAWMCVFVHNFRDVCYHLVYLLLVTIVIIANCNIIHSNICIYTYSTAFVITLL